MSEGVDRVLSFLEQTDEVEYDSVIALQHLNQALFEISEDGEFEILKTFSSYLWDADSFASYEDADEPSSTVLWPSGVPGSVSVTDLVGRGFQQYGYVDRVWLDISGTQSTDFKQMPVNQLLSTYGDTTGVPERYAIDGKYIYLRPYPASGTEYTLRTRWVELPVTVGTGAEPDLMIQAPYACIYRACLIGALWADDDEKAAKYERLGSRAIERFAIRNSMVGDAETEAGEYNG